MNDDIENMILRTVERWWAGRYNERHAVVTAYDKKNYLAKVKYQPEGQESGWLPIETGHIGNGYGIAIGLQPGHGNADSQSGSGLGGAKGMGQGNDESNSGDQVVVRHQEGDFESGKIVQRVHSDNDKPPQVESGEIVVWTKFPKKKSGGGQTTSGSSQEPNQQIWFKKDGSIHWTDGNGATIHMDGKGNVTITAKKITANASDAIAIKGKKSIDIVGDGVVTVTSKVATKINGKPIDFNGGGPPGLPFSVPG